MKTKNGTRQRGDWRWRRRRSRVREEPHAMPRAKERKEMPDRERGAFGRMEGGR
jgi:hypothetical protein